MTEVTETNRGLGACEILKKDDKMTLRRTKREESEAVLE